MGKARPSRVMGERRQNQRAGEHGIEAVARRDFVTWATWDARVGGDTRASGWFWLALSTMTGVPALRADGRPIGILCGVDAVTRGWNARRRFVRPVGEAAVVGVAVRGQLGVCMCSRREAVTVINQSLRSTVTVINRHCDQPVPDQPVPVINNATEHGCER